MAETCPYVTKCGACHVGTEEYSTELENKRDFVKKCIGKYCRRINDTIGMFYPYNYRYKVHAVFGKQKGKVVAGMYKEGTHQIVPIEDCKIEAITASRIIKTTTKLIEDFKFLVYDEDKHTGFMRHILIRKADHTKQVMVILVTADSTFPHKNHFVNELLREHPEITTIVQNVNGANSTMVLGEQNKVLYGPGFIDDMICGLKFRISPNSFYQVNPAQTQQLYKKAIEIAELKGTETVIDAYCGIGTIGMAMAKNAGQVFGIELNKEAIKDAIINAKRNMVQNIKFINADATKYMTAMAEAGMKVDVVVLDPPRSGSTPDFVRAVKKINPEKVVYVSCNPETLGRDLDWFHKIGYFAKVAYPVDMFPWTEHVECVTLLTKEQD